MKSGYYTFGLLLVLGLSATAVASPPPAQVGSRLTAANGHTLYTYDRDTTAGRSDCSGSCARVWPPCLTASAQASGQFSVITRKDGRRQWAKAGKPLYTYAGDASAGSTQGDGVNGTWHVAR